MIPLHLPKLYIRTYGCAPAPSSYPALSLPRHSQTYRQHSYIPKQGRRSLRNELNMTEPLKLRSNTSSSNRPPGPVVDEGANRHWQSSTFAESLIQTEPESYNQGVRTVRGRTLVLCFDGTAGKYDTHHSNVVTLFSLLSKDPFEQLCYYQPGIGTWFKPGIVSPLLHWGAKVVDLAIAWYLEEHVLDGYRFVMQNYSAGDRICLFGFSRGAYTARALAGMLHKIGLLPKDNDAQMPFAFELFKREDEDGLNLCAGFKRTYCQDVKIEFVGVWDTVASVGVIAGRMLPFTNSNRSIKTFPTCHRARFRPNLWHRAPPEEKPPGGARTVLIPPEHVLHSYHGSDNDPQGISKPKKNLANIFKKAESDLAKAGFGGPSRKDSKGKPPFMRMGTFESEGSSDVLEVWFCGCHSDVGGGSVSNATQNSLSYISLRWMVRQAASAGCGIKFDPEALARANIELGNGDVPEELSEMDKADALEPIQDYLKKKPLWWALELMPMTYVWQDREGEWHCTWRWHLGKGRTVEDHHPKFHETVRVRSEHKGMGYKPKAGWEAGNETYVR
ncbi:hypothetical protein DFP72DRAFT_916052 [Ephemerocybe angulata]|uniref:T6SS Phospholipase effector Tle1-like catalytic domain-containing protein n=1 Tax=Ephemerocybe angulata TaxID=980116 RepID=A0A8H6M161_9AGAR|nr:hypothetical protein DFP72DRAFT_916052 [Tulosesus angulatus]